MSLTGRYGLFEATFRMVSLISGLLVSAMTALSPTIGVADVLCQAADPKHSYLKVRKSPNGEVVDRLQNELLVDIDGRRADAAGRVWVNVSSDHLGEAHNLGWVPRDDLQCVDVGRFPRENPSVAAMRAVGIVPQGANQTLPIPCDEVPNGWGVTISNALYEAYSKRGFSKAALCLALGGDGIYFDPATGRRLSLYKFSGDLQDLRPFWLPDCFRQVEIVRRQGTYLVTWRPTGCTMRYHPSTGLRIKNPELVELHSGGEAGGGVDEDNRSSSISESRLKDLVSGK